MHITYCKTCVLNLFVHFSEKLQDENGRFPLIFFSLVLIRLNASCLYFVGITIVSSFERLFVQALVDMVPAVPGDWDVGIYKRSQSSVVWVSSFVRAEGLSFI